MPLSTLVVYLGGYFVLVFFAICVATGLYYIAELVEEHSRLAKKVISGAIQGIIGLHVVLWLVDGLPFLPVAVGVATHALYHHLLRSFPFISATSPEFLASAGMCIASHVAWFRMFASGPHVSLEWALGFLVLLLWLVPFAFFISLAANEAALPGAGVSPRQMGGGGVVNAPSDGLSRLEASRQGLGGRGRSSLLALFTFLQRKRDAMMPLISERLGLGSTLHKHAGKKV
eukprot:TRINITY_DN15032_c0_g1_i1.p1 TRINITY_DN15032_c0_g1~~TRINITY_DN15032_c0_g1_i1.p1  ORF type:complete len:230 (-),score=44.38 TRINITY_DN15032_c0_g1_i1:578-1267(-)